MSFSVSECLSFWKAIDLKYVSTLTSRKQNFTLALQNDVKSDLTDLLEQICFQKLLWNFKQALCKLQITKFYLNSFSFYLHTPLLPKFL